jgi:TorA maturation chaperone TorD
VTTAAQSSALVEDVLGLAARWQRPADPALADEYERLFVGPGRVPCPPYESLWRDDVPPRLAGSLLGPCVGDLESCYDGLGLRVAPGELADHVAVELEALAVALTGTESLPIAAALLRDHLTRWAGAFCAAVGRHADSGYYRTLAADTIRLLGTVERSVTAPDG